MPRRVEDIVPNGKRSIRDIPINHDKPKGELHHTKSGNISGRYDISNQMKGGTDVPLHITTDEREPISQNRINIPPISRERNKKRGNIGKWLGITLLICISMGGVVFIASKYFMKATLVFTQKIIKIDVDDTYAAGSSNGLDLKYTLERNSETLSTVAPALYGSDISTKATGQIRVYNNFSKETQRLVAGTRFSMNGKVYRLINSIVIPGKNNSGPGSIVTDIIADKPGQEYNINGTENISDFKIIAYEGTPRGDTIYGRITEPIVGGYSGKKITVDDRILKDIIASTSLSMKDKLFGEISSTIEEKSLVYKDSCIYTQDSPQFDELSDDNAKVIIQAHLICPIFDKKQFITKLAGNSSVASFNSHGYSVKNIEGLSVEILNASTTPPTIGGNPISLRISGQFEMIGNIPTEKVRKDILGKNMIEVREYMAQYQPVFINLDIRLMPPWITKIPENIEKIRFIIKEPNKALDVI